MIYYVSADAPRNGNGQHDRPFRHIQDAAALAKPGDEVRVLPGIYRETVCPIFSGIEESPIVYKSVEPGKAVITGAEPITIWQPLDGIWAAYVPNGFFGSYNPYTTVIQGDWYSSQDPVHTGDIYLNGQALYEVFTLEDVRHPKINPASWAPEESKLVWYTRQQDDFTILYANFGDADPNQENVEINVRRNCFTPKETGINYITVSGFTIRQAATTWAPPTAFQDGMVAPRWSRGWIIEDCEISDSRCSGISLGKYLQPENENKWSTQYLKDGTQTEREAICQAQREGWTKESIGSHIVRRCNIHHCGQTGIVGHLGCVFSIIEDNHIHHINNRQDLAGAEIGGIKLHAAIDVQIRRNHIHHCTRGLWLDWQAQGTRVTQNLFHDNQPPKGTHIANRLALAEDIFIEVSHGPTLVDNNICLSAVSARLCTQGIAFVHNLLAGSLSYVGNGTENGGVRFATPRYTPYHVPHRTEIAGFMTILHGDARFYNNIFIQQPISKEYVAYARDLKMDTPNLLNFVCGTKPYDGYPLAETYYGQFSYAAAKDGSFRDLYYDHLPVSTGGNVFVNGAQPSNQERNYTIMDSKASLRLTEADGRPKLNTNLFELLPQTEPLQMISTDLLGKAFEPEQLFENPDGSPILFDTDYLGKKRTLPILPGPFASIEDAESFLI